MNESYKIKEFVRKNFPRIFADMRRIKDQLVIEAQVIRQVGPRLIIEWLLPRGSSWQDVLPLQTVRQFNIPELKATTAIELVDYLKQMGIAFAQGGHTIYIMPESLRKSVFNTICADYPPDVGLKIVKNPGAVSDGEYVHGEGHSRIHRKITHGHRLLTLVANLLHIKGIGPRLYDLVELKFGDQIWAAYVIAHCAGRVPTLTECKIGLSQLQELEQRKLVKVITPGGFEHIDFQCPDCNGNCLIDEVTGQFQYLDFQNFLLTDYEKYLKELVLRAAENTHFGDRSILRGGRYLYQSVPGIGSSAKRNVEERIDALKTMMDKVGFSIKDRLILDFGCNLGMMLGQYLKIGASWGHGWDLDNVVPHTRDLLLTLGCTRFSLTSGTISPDQAVETDLPEFLRTALNGCVISYLAVRGHIGWLNALRSIPWAFMIYEGHESDSADDLSKIIHELNQLVPVQVVATATYRDGDSRVRPIALIIREK